MRACHCRFFYAVSLPLLLGGIVYMLWFMPAPDTNLAVKVNVGLAWCALGGKSACCRNLRCAMPALVRMQAAHACRSYAHASA